MNEALLQFAWATLRFDLKDFKTFNGKVVEIIFAGRLNLDAGADFLDAKVCIEGVEWFGAVEIHKNSADWYAHKHHQDKVYNNVILSVVENSDGREIKRSDGTIVPEISIGKRLAKDLVEKYNHLIKNKHQLACSGLARQVHPFKMKQWITVCGCNRLEKKAGQLLENQLEDDFSWEQIAWENTAAAVGGKLNQDAFIELAKNISANIIGKYTDNQTTVEALLFGGAGFLAHKNNDYIADLQNDWHFLKEKHPLLEIENHRFKSFRLRPISFPAVRLAQLAAMWHYFQSFTKLILEPQSLLNNYKQIQPSPFWENHYHFDKESTKKKKNLGIEIIHNLLINSLIPLSIIYYRRIGNEIKAQESIELLQTLSPEKNSITKIFENEGFRIQNALESQGLIHLWKNFCQPRNCLKCAIGLDLLKK